MEIQNGTWSRIISFFWEPSQLEIRRIAPIQVQSEKYLLAPSNSGKVYWDKT